jgi:hypothetical protein
MPHTTRWLVDKRVIYVEFEGRITKEELQQFVDEVKALLDEGIPLVHLITNSLDMEKVDISMGTLRTLAGAYNLTGQLGWTVDINNNPILKMFAGISSQFAGVRQRTVSSLDEAVNFLKENDDTLADSTWYRDDSTQEANSV